MIRKAENMVMSSFAGDSLALGAHWIYDVGEIERRFTRIDSLMKPGPDSHHNTKDKGEFTHLGDQAFVLLESIAESKSFDLDNFSQNWKDLFKNYNGYIDYATTQTLELFAAGGSATEGGSPSPELAGASRIAPLVYVYHDDPEQLISAARAQTRLTHNNPLVLDCAAFLAWTAYHVLHGLTPIGAMEKTASEEFKDNDLAEWMEEGVESIDLESNAVIMDFGQSCHSGEVFSGVVHLIAKYENNLEEALIRSVMAGGDSAARAMAVGMVLGAYEGAGKLPDKWLSEMKRAREISNLLHAIG